MALVMHPGLRVRADNANSEAWVPESQAGANIVAKGRGPNDFHDEIVSDFVLAQLPKDLDARFAGVDRRFA
jgi:hypothetical protein